MGLAGAGAPEIQRGDHACGVFGSDDEQARLVAGFAQDAFARGDRVFYLADRVDESGVLSFIDEAGLDGRALLYAGALRVMPSSAMGLDSGFDKERQLAVWDQLLAQARADGYGGLAVAAEMTWALSWHVDSDVLVDYEASAAPVFASGELSALCQYDRRFFNEDTLGHINHAHPYGVTVNRNGYSIDYARLHLERAATAGRFSLGGEIDLANTDFLERQLWEQLRDGDAVVDCSAITFVDVAGCRLLRQACRGGVGGGRLMITNPPSVLTRVMSICEWADGEAA